MRKIVCLHLNGNLLKSTPPVANGTWKAAKRLRNSMRMPEMSSPFPYPRINRRMSRDPWIRLANCGTCESRLRSKHSLGMRRT